MRTAEWITLIFFSFFILVSWLRSLKRRARIAVAAIGATGVILIMCAQLAHRFLAPIAVSVARDWLPAMLLPMMYWQAGCFAVTPNDSFQRALQKLDDRLLGNWMKSLTTKLRYRWIFTSLELAYLACYLLVPLGLGVLYLTHTRRYADEYWLVVLSATYPCYAFTAFVQTLPPRLFEADSVPALSSKVRTFNLWVVRRVTTCMNMFPSGHVTATLGGSLVLLRHVPEVGWVFVLTSIGIALGAVTGRYHYTADVVLAAVMVIVVYSLERLLT